MKCAVEFQNVSASYPQAEVLKGLTFSISEGEMTALIGPNGAGKSTLFRVLTGLHPTSAGRVLLFGRDILTIGARERARLVAVVPQELITPMAFTVEEIVMLGRSVGLSPWQKPSEHDRSIVERAMAYADISSLRDRSLNALSGGEKQRTIVAMALAQEPRLVLMDEPTTHLDMNHAIELLQMIRSLNAQSGVTVLMTSHDLNLASIFCRRVIALDQGRIVADGSPPDILNADNIKSIFDCHVRVLQEPVSGSTIIVPAPPPQFAPESEAGSVLIISGGGSGCEIMRRLRLAGYRVACGALNEGDTDALCAKALGIESALEKPFSPIGPETLARANGMALDAESVIVCDTPFGSGNVSNLDIAEKALSRGALVLLNDNDLEGRDYTGTGEAVARIKRMISEGAIAWRRPNEALAILARHKNRA